MDALKTFFRVSNILMMILIISSNVFVIIAMAISRPSKKCKNMFLFSIAIADLFIGVFVIPSVLSVQFFDTPVTKGMCKLCTYMEYLSVAAGIFSITGLAADRARAILCVHQFRVKSVVSSILALVVVWILAAVFAFRGPIVFDAVQMIVGIQGNITLSVTICTVSPDKIDLHNLLTVFDFAFLFIVPVLVILVSNMTVSCTVLEASKTNVKNAKRRKFVRILLAMTIVFIVCHLPFDAFRMCILSLNKKIEDSDIILASFLLLKWLNSFLNVVFYYFMSERFHEVLAKIRTRLFRQVPSIQVQPQITTGDTVTVVTS